jgi:hypothetical protein
MHKQILHRLYTEDTNRVAITDLLSKHLQAFTIMPATGYWDSTPEMSLCIEIMGVSFSEMAAIGTAIKELGKQQAVLYTAHEVKTRLI